MAMRVCAESGCPELTTTTRCQAHTQQREQQRGTPEQRGYGTAHRKLRKRWAREVAKGTINCARCGKRISIHDPWDLDHTDDRAGYLGPSHRACNRATAGRTPMVTTPRRSLDLTLVTGPPCSGKTTYVAQHKQPGDVVLDYDAIAVALGSDDTHSHPTHYMPLIMHAIDAVIERASRDHTARLWLIKCQPTPRDQALATRIVQLEVDEATCHARAAADGRPETWAKLISDWFTVSHM